MSARAENEQISVALNLLQANGDDLRNNPASADADAELRASILAHGLLEPLVVRNREGVWYVIAGHRRLRALRALAEAGEIAAAYAVGCTVLHDQVDATEAALAENTVRVAMHPADQAITFARLADAGASIEDIGHRFGMNKRTVAKRLRLGKLEPTILEKFRSGEISEDVAAAYATTANHERQLAAWEKIEADQWGNHHTGSVLHLLQDDLVRSDSPIAQFVGAKQYAEAGGAGESTLFEDYSMLSDYDLLRKLALEKLQRAADRVTGWKWVKCLQPEDELWNVRQDYTQLYAQPALFTDAERETIEAEQRFMAEHQEDGDDLSPELEAEWGKISAAADEVRRVQAGRRHWTDDQKAGAGVLLYIGNGGTVERTEGLVRKGDPVPGRDDEPANGAPRTDPITGREVAEKPKGYSQGLSESITEFAQRRAAPGGARPPGDRRRPAQLQPAVLDEGGLGCAHRWRRLLPVPAAVAAQGIPPAAAGQGRDRSRGRVLGGSQAGPGRVVGREAAARRAVRALPPAAGGREGHAHRRPVRVRDVLDAGRGTEHLRLPRGHRERA